MSVVLRAVHFDVDGTLVDSMPNLPRTTPLETFPEVAPAHDPETCLAVLHDLEDLDARAGRYRAFAGARLPLPAVLIDAACVERGKPDPQGYLLAAGRLGRSPADCLVVEDSRAGALAGRSADMTVWIVNADTNPEPAHRCYATLEAALPDIRAWVLPTRRG
jgi:mannitol-1-/sugar-/sorbitol-6-phosphatase